MCTWSTRSSFKQSQEMASRGIKTKWKSWTSHHNQCKIGCWGRETSFAPSLCILCQEYLQSALGCLWCLRYGLFHFVEDSKLLLTQWVPLSDQDSLFCLELSLCKEWLEDPLGQAGSGCSNASEQLSDYHKQLLSLESSWKHPESGWKLCLRHLASSWIIEVEKQLRSFGNL